MRIYLTYYPNSLTKFRFSEFFFLLRVFLSADEKNRVYEKTHVCIAACVSFATGFSVSGRIYR